MRCYIRSLKKYGTIHKEVGNEYYIHIDDKPYGSVYITDKNNVLVYYENAS